MHMYMYIYLYLSAHICISYISASMYRNSLKRRYYRQFVY